MLFSIYKVTNKINGKEYVGFTKHTAKKRFNNHVYEANTNCDNYKFHNAIRKYGKESFIVETLYQSTDERYTIEVMEPHFIAEYDTYNNGYNMTKGGDRGPKLVGKANGFYGKKHTEESKRKMSESSKGKNTGKNNGMSRPEVRKKVGDAVRGGKTACPGEKNGMYGKKHSPETILKMKQKRWPDKYPT